MFNSSRSFRQCLEAKKVEKDIEFLPDAKFIRQMSGVLLDHFKYRV